MVDEEKIGVWGWVVRRHLAHCPACREELVALRALEERLVVVSPVVRRPILRPMGLARPLWALGALAVVAGYFFWQPHQTAPTVTVALASPTPTPTPSPSMKPRLAPKPVPPVRRLKVARRHSRRVRRPAAVPEPVVVVVAKAPPLAKPLTLVHDSRDDDGGTIHIETTIPAAYVAAMQTASLTSGETNL